MPYSQMCIRDRSHVFMNILILLRSINTRRERLLYYTCAALKIGDFLRQGNQKAAMNLGMNVMVLDVNQGAWKLETERGFTGMVADHRNILKILVDPELKETTTAVQYDVTVRKEKSLFLREAESNKRCQVFAPDAILTIFRYRKAPV